MKEIFTKLTELIESHNKIIIATHKDPDFDGMGAAIALQQIVNSYKKENYIVINERRMNSSLKKAFNLLNENKITTSTISKNEVLNNIDSKTLVIVLDTHKKEMLEEPRILDNTRVVVLDHHLKGKNYIKDTTLSYINANVSSTVEIIVEYLKYLNKTIPELVATFLLVGLEIDTNHFRVKTTATTYESAAFLARLGVDNILKQELLQETKEEYLKRQKLIKASFMINEHMVMCVTDNDMYEAKDLASIADKLLQFEHVEASFVVGNLSSKTVGVSARSIGKVNVEEIMAKIGGGGHMYEAATQLKNVTLKEAKEIVINAIGGI